MWKDLFFGVGLSRIIPLKKIKKLFDIIITVLIIEIDDESDRCNGKYLYFFGLAINLQIFDKGIFCSNFFIKLKMIDYLLFSIAVHFLVVMFVFIENPFEIRNSFSIFYLFPDFSIIQNLSNQFFIIIPFDNNKSQLFTCFYLIYLLHHALLYSLLGISPDSMR